MSESYFTPENAMQRFFYLQGFTSDEFYTDSGICADLEWLLFKELQKNGYERIIFYDKDWKLYCFDDNSLQLMLYGRRAKEGQSAGGEADGTDSGQTDDAAGSTQDSGHTQGMVGEDTQRAAQAFHGTKTESAAGGFGLKKGKWGKKKTNHKAADTDHARTAERSQNEKNTAKDSQNADHVQNAGRSLVQQMPDTPLHGGIQDNEMVYRQIDACMTDGTIKTAVVINDAGDFIQDLGRGRQHNIQNYTKLPASNQNIMIFIYSDQKMLSLLEMPKQIEEQPQQVQPDELSQMSEVISVYCPNALELRNMLNYFRLASDLRVDKKAVNLRVRRRDMLEIAIELKRYMSEGKHPIGIKQLYHKLLRYAASGKELTAENCYQIFGEKKHLTGEEQMNRLIGMENVKRELLKFKGNQVSSQDRVRYLTASRIQPDLPVPEKKELMHVVLTGNPGTGKTTVAKLLGQLYFEMGYLSSGHVVETDRTGLVAGYVGQTAIKTRGKVQEALGGVLFIDEAYALKKDEKSDNSDFGQEAIDVLVKAMDEFKGQFILVAAGYQNEMKRFIESNPGLSSRFRLHLHIEDYTPQEMKQILELRLQERHCRFSASLAEQMDVFCENWVNLAGEDWGNGREADNLAANLELSWKNDPQRRTETEEGQVWCILEERHLPEDKRACLQSMTERRENVMDELNHLTGLSYVKEQIEKIRKRMVVGDITSPGHYIFSGNPGTGKTMVARYMGNILRTHGLLKRGNLVEYRAGDLVNLVSQGKTFTELAEKALNGVLFIDEAYQLLDSGVGQKILSDLLPFMENNRNRLCVICAGYEEEMERFLAYNSGFKSRFHETILFENYSGEELCSILCSMLKEKGYEADSQYQEYSLRALTRYVEIYGKKKDFGNARYIRNEYILHSLDARNERLFREYGEMIPQEKKKLLTGEDIPKELAKYAKEKLPKKDIRSAAQKIEELIGYEEIKKELRRLLASANYRNEDGFGAKLVPETLHWVLRGNPGTGKTTIAKLLGQVYKECGLLAKGHTVKVTRTDLVAEFEGQTAGKTRRMIEKAMDGVLFIDEAYSLIKGEAQGGGFGAEAVSELVEKMTDRNGEFAVIAAGYPAEMDEFLRSNSGLESRFQIFTLEDYTPEELHQILRLKCGEAQMELESTLDEKMDVFFANYKNLESRKRVWSNGREVENLLRSMQHLWFEHPVTVRDQEGTLHRILSERHLPKELRRHLNGTPKEEKKKASALERVRNMTGFASVKEKLEDLLLLGELSRQEGMEDLREDNTLHWVLKGNPGTGKTTVAKMIGEVYKEIGLLENGKCVKVTRADLCGEYVGQTAIKTRQCIDRAMGGVLFIDEAYMLKREGASGNDYGQEAIDILLEAMSDKNGLFAVIAAGYPREMDVFLNSNPGFASRFNDNIFMLDDYSAEELVQIFESISREKKFSVSEELRELLIPMFDNMLKARIKNWANGREAENLQKQMRVTWSKAPVIKTEEDGTKIRIFEPWHLPEKYRKYCSIQQRESMEGSEKDERNGRNE